MKIGVIGLGNMGLPIAQNMLQAGHQLVVFNRTANKAKPLVEKGARLAASPVESARETNLVFTILSDDKSTEEIVFGQNGILEGLAEGGIHVAVSTISVECAQKLAKAHSERGQQFVSATVLGRPDAAAAAALRLIVAGPQKARKKIWPVLEAIGQNIFVVGDEGYLSNVAKLGNNFLIVAMLEALSEVLILVEKYGIEQKQFLEIVNTLFASPIYQNYGNIIAERNFEPAGFKMNLGLKDVELMLSAADQVSALLPLADLAKNHYSEGIARGWANLDWAALIKCIEAVSLQEIDNAAKS
ncbi:NAD(P)-dependent oxidoreductase [Bacillus massiliglaciei]|uniref:NAD(P)-dependent oxidoreductase n=1 Tax=Bacillus massiliglaciei TaxID=1816693 RepID=UPI000A57F364|nr:NAD(P)-dependent oxidoreductase [Bacillus massiliglaciei]